MHGLWAAVLAVVMGGFVAGAGWAEESLDTASGPATITKGEGQHVLRIAGTAFPIDGMMFVSFADRVGNLVLVQMSSGGSLCPAEFAWLDTSPGKVRLTETFGTCSDLYEIAADAETVTVTMPGAPGQGRSAFVWDGKGRIVEQKLGMEPTGKTPEMGAEGWVGQHPYGLVTAPEWAGVFTDLMGGEALSRVQAAMAIGNEMERQGDWVAGRGCQAHMCDAVRAAVAVSAVDGRVVVALWEYGNGPRLWGDASAGLPPAVAQVMAGQ